MVQLPANLNDRNQITLCYHLASCHEGGRVVLSRGDMARDARLGLRTLQRTLAALIEAGHIVREPPGASGLAPLRLTWLSPHGGTAVTRDTTPDTPRQHPLTKEALGQHRRLLEDLTHRVRALESSQATRPAPPSPKPPPPPPSPPLSPRSGGGPARDLTEDVERIVSIVRDAGEAGAQAADLKRAHEAAGSPVDWFLLLSTLMQSGRIVTAGGGRYRLPDVD